MTHDELLARIDELYRRSFHVNKEGEELYVANNFRFSLTALRAVVELHTPIYDNSCSDPDCCGGPYPDLCNGCGDDYPCATIQAIEKELK